jgi:hypothetical protein
MTNMLEYLMQNNKYVIALTIVSLAIKACWPYINFNADLIVVLIKIRTIFNWLMALAFINFMVFFLLAIFYKPANNNSANLFKKWVPIVTFTLPFILYGGVIYMAANNTWTELVIFGFVFIANQFLVKKLNKSKM